MQLQPSRTPMTFLIRIRLYMINSINVTSIQSNLWLKTGFVSNFLFPFVASKFMLEWKIHICSILIVLFCSVSFLDNHNSFHLIFFQCSDNWFHTEWIEPRPGLFWLTEESVEGDHLYLKVNWAAYYHTLEIEPQLEIPTLISEILPHGDKSLNIRRPEQVEECVQKLPFNF